MDRAELPITGYLDRFSRRPGERFTAHVSLDAPGPARARLVRVISGDPNPEGPGLRTDDLSAVFDISFDGLHQPVALGSHALIPRAPARPPDGACTWTVLAWSQAPGPSRAVLSERDDAVAVTLLYGRAGAEAELVWPGGSLRLATGLPATPHGWCRLWLSVHPATGRVTLGQRTLRGLQAVATGAAPGVALPAGGAVLIAAANPGAPERHYTGRLENPAILDGSVEAWSDPLVLPALSPLAIWDFAEGIDGLAVTDAGPQGCHGTLVNLPTRGVAGARWSGAEQFWRHAPQDYAAIHFHDDDLKDCGWAPSFTFDVPNDLASGSYALHLTTAGGEDWLPFYVLPKREGRSPASPSSPPPSPIRPTPTTPAATPMPTTTPASPPGAPTRTTPTRCPSFAHSTYNRHATAAACASPRGCGRSSTCGRASSPSTTRAARACATTPPTPISWPGWTPRTPPSTSSPTRISTTRAPRCWPPIASCSPAAIPATTRRPRSTRCSTSSITADGSPVSAVRASTGASRGRRRCRMSSRCAAPRAASAPGRPSRANTTTCSMAAMAGCGGATGGRRNCWPGSASRHREASSPPITAGCRCRYEPRFSWMFEGVETDILGDRGLSGGGAAGYEMDRADISLGTPADAVILARSEQPPASLVTVPEELLSHLATVNGEPPEALKRCEMVYFDTPSGGAVFSAGSATFCGSLWQNGAFQGPVSQLLYNVVRRFMTWRVGDAALRHAPPGARG